MASTGFMRLYIALSTGENKVRLTQPIAYIF